MSGRSTPWPTCKPYWITSIEDDSPAAQALAAGFKRTAGHLTRHPFIGRRGDLEGTRELMLHRNYLLTYRVSSEAVEILQIRRVAQKRFH